jgi:hypothetical protein
MAIELDSIELELLAGDPVSCPSGGTPGHLR